MTSYGIVLTDGLRRLLLARARRVEDLSTTANDADDGAANAAIALDLAVSEDTVRKWRRRFSENGVNGLRDLPRTGRPRGFSAGAVADVGAEVKALACELPADSDTPLAK